MQCKEFGLGPKLLCIGVFVLFLLLYSVLISGYTYHTKLTTPSFSFSFHVKLQL